MRCLCQVLLVVFTVCAAAAAEAPVPLQAGRLSVEFEPDTAMLRNVRFGPHKVLQGINAPVRDQFWGTVPPVVSEMQIDQQAEHFTLTFVVDCSEREIDFRWRGRIHGTAAGQLTFTFDGEAQSSFLRNRIGFCVLHGPEAAGRRCRVTTVDGMQSTSSFPEFIAPHQPFRNLAGIAHHVADDLWAHLGFAGDVFETEDQRNWTDASFKTYCTPLDLPFPVRVPRGAKVSQQITLTLEGDLSRVHAAAKDADAPLKLTLSDTADERRLPAIGVRDSSVVDELSDIEADRLRTLRLDHLRVDLDTARGNVGMFLERASQRAKRLGVGLHVALHPGDHPHEELDRLVREVQSIRLPVSHWLVISTDGELVARVRERLRRVQPEARVGIGQDTNFTELNRNRPDPKLIDVVSYGVNPQVHAFDDRSLVETLPIQADTVRTARQFAGDSAILVSPISLRPQTVNREPAEGELPSDVDPRQASLFAAAWTLGSIASLAEAGVEGATYYETVGWKGLMESAAGSLIPGRFPSQPGSVFPIYHVLADVADVTGGRARSVSSADPLSVVALAIESDRMTRLLAANMTDGPIRVEIDGLEGTVVLRHLDERSLESATMHPERFRQQTGDRIDVPGRVLPLELLPHAIVRIDELRDAPPAR